MIKKIISALLSVVLIFGSMLTISAAYEISEPVQNVYNVTATVTSDADLGPITAYIKRVDIADAKIYGIGQENAILTDGTYKYTFVFTMYNTTQSGTYRIFFGDGIQTTKDYEYTRVQDIVDFYNQLDALGAADLTADADVIKTKLLAGEASGYLTYDLTQYKTLNANVRKLVDKEIESWNLATSIPGLAATESSFATQMDEVMLRARIANAESSTFGAVATAAIAATTLDGSFYDKVTPATVASFMHPETITSISNATLRTRFSEAVLLAVAKESDYLTLYDATDYFIDNSILSLDGTKLATLVSYNLHINLFKELVKDTYAFDTVTSFESVASPLMNSLLEQIGGTLQPQKPVGGNAGAAVGTPSRPVTSEEGNVVFNDLGPVSWAQEAITYLAERGIVAGRDKGVFAPNDGVTREEMVKLVVTAFSDTNSGAECDFSDVSTDRWSYAYIAKAHNLGLITGVDASNFEPTGSITRENLAVILYRTYNYAGKKVVAENASYTDSENISSYAKDAVNAMAKLGIMEGMGDGTFSPKTVVTRAQAAKVIYSLITLIGGNI